MTLYGHKQWAYGLEGVFLPSSYISSTPRTQCSHSCNWQTANTAGWLFACPCKIKHDKPMRGGAVPVVNTFRIQEKQSVDLRIWFVKLISIHSFLNHSSLNLTVVWFQIHRWQPQHILSNKLVAALRNRNDLTVYCGIVIEALKSALLPPRGLF